MEWFYLPLRDVMTAENTFNWDALEKKLADISSRGHQAVFRFYVDYPKKSTGIPQYLLDAGLATYAYTDSSNQTSSTPSVSPDYTDRRLIKAFTDFITAFGAKYDGDPRIGFVTAGLYGFWGEWHVHSHPAAGEPAGWAISQADKDLLLSTYLSSFTKTIVLIRYANCTYDDTLKNSFGYHDDSFFYATIDASKSSYFWTQMKTANLTGIWKTKPVGGEVRPELQNAVWDFWPNTTGEDVSNCISTTHASWMLNSGVFKTSLSGDPYANALRAHRMFGYQLYVPSATLTPQSDGSLRVSVNIENKGVAPFYYNWTVECALVDASGNILSTKQTDWLLRDVLPGSENIKSMQTIFPSVPSGSVYVLMRVANPLSNGNPVAFANETYSANRKGWLTLLKIR
jgi:hypothetical protein